MIFGKGMNLNILDLLPNEIMECWKEIQDPAVIHNERMALYANDSFLELFGINRLEELNSREMGEFISPWSPFHVRAGMREAMGRRRDGDNMDVMVVTSPLTAKDGLLYSTILQDIGQQKSWEEKVLQGERLAAMGKLAGEIAHEINNPLGGILLYANLLKDDICHDSVALENISKIVKLATRCRIIAKGLLNFGRTPSQSCMTVDLNQVIREMFSLLEDHKMFRDVDVRMDLQADLPHIMADKGQMEQAMLNLMVNAGEAMDGEGVMTIRSYSLRAERRVCVAVQDTGPGVDDEIKTRIFEPFFSTKPFGKGTGLGLSITYGIVQRHRGRITVEDAPGGGAIFMITLPADI